MLNCVFTAKELDAQSSLLTLLLRCTLIPPIGPEEPDEREIFWAILMDISMCDSAWDTSRCPPCCGTSTSGDVSVCTAAIAEKGNAATGHSFQ
jgi:hypothetical protein